MLEHQKIVLRGVSNEPKLFKKELQKSLCWLNANERSKLENGYILTMPINIEK